MNEHEYDRERSLGRAVGIIHRHGMIYMDKELAALGLGRGTFLFMVTLYFNDGMRQEEITRELGINKGTTARAISKLERLGYVERQGDPTDRRARRVMLTDKARAARPEFMRVLDRGSDILAEGFTQAEKHRALDLLKRMGANMARYVAEAREQESAQ